MAFMIRALQRDTIEAKQRVVCCTKYKNTNKSLKAFLSPDYFLQLRSIKSE